MNAPASPLGVWMGVSHQTVIITHIVKDGTFSGTYFTPQHDVKLTFDGRWKLEGDELTLIYEKSVPPGMKCPLEDRNRIETTNPDELTLHTLPSGLSVTWKRVQFVERPLPECKRKLREPRNPPTLAQLRKFKVKNLEENNVINDWIDHLIEMSPIEYYDQKMYDVLKNKVPEKAGFIFCIPMFEGRYFNGGMESAILGETEKEHQFFLKRVADGYAFYGCAKTAALIRKLAQLSKKWMKQNQELMARNAPDEEFKPISEEIESYEPIYDALIGEEGWQQACAKEIRTNPQDYTLAKEK